MTDYTPEKVTELIAEARDLGDKRRHFWPTPRVMAAVFRRLADALKAVTAERDELRAAIAEASAHEWSNYGNSETFRILSRIPEHPKED